MQIQKRESVIPLLSLLMEDESNFCYELVIPALQGLSIPASPRPPFFVFDFQPYK